MVDLSIVMLVYQRVQSTRDVKKKIPEGATLRYQSSEDAAG